MIGTFEAVIIDCPEPKVLARFYAELLGGEIVQWDEERAEVVMPNGRPLIAFQRVDAFHQPTWPTQDVPQQFHIDVRVDDFDATELAVLAIGATRTGDEHPGFRVYLDPAGHPFCLIIPGD